MISILNMFAFFFVVEDYLVGKSTAVAYRSYLGRKWIESVGPFVRRMGKDD